SHRRDLDLEVGRAGVRRCAVKRTERPGHLHAQLLDALARALEPFAMLGLARSERTAEHGKTCGQRGGTHGALRGGRCAGKSHMTECSHRCRRAEKGARSRGSGRPAPLRCPASSASRASRIARKAGTCAFATDTPAGMRSLIGSTYLPSRWTRKQTCGPVASPVWPT